MRLQGWGGEGCPDTDNSQHFLPARSVPGTVHPTALWGRLSHNPHFIARKTKTQRGDRIIMQLGSTRAGIQTRTGDHYAPLPYAFTNLSVHGPPGPPHTPRIYPSPLAPTIPLGHLYAHRDGAGLWSLSLGKVCAPASRSRVGSYQVREDVGQDSVH